MVYFFAISLSMATWQQAIQFALLGTWVWSSIMGIAHDLYDMEGQEDIL